MSERTKLGLKILQSAILAGVAGNALLRATPWGINQFLFLAVLITAVVLLTRMWKRVDLMTGRSRSLLIGIAALSIFMVWRDSSTLVALDLLGILLALALLTMYTRGNRIDLSGITEYVLGAIVSGANAVFGILGVAFSDIKWGEIQHKRWTSTGASVAKGLIIAAPLLMIFTLLFVAADAVFEGMVKSVQFRADIALSHIFLTLLIMWLVAGFLRGLLAAEPVSLKSTGITDFFSPAPANANLVSVEVPPAPASSPSQQANTLFSLGNTELSVALGLINALFLTFVITQLRYFFGGEALARATAGLTFAEYARRGFFELVTVAMLVLPILLVAHYLLRKESPAVERRFRWMATSLIVLLFVIMSSAFVRMWVYQRSYGLTGLRLYTTAFMIWLGVVFVWFCLTVLRGQRQRFAWGAAVSAFFIIALLHALNPDSFITRVNVAHAQRGTVLDACYLSTLSADAVPDLVQALPRLKPGDRSIVSYQLLQNWSPSGRSDWRTWNLSRWSAHRAVKQQNSQLWVEALSNDARSVRCGSYDF